MNKTLRVQANEILKGLLAQCTEPQIMIFKRMYSHKNLDLDIDEVVENMEESKIDVAISQCERTVSNNLKKA